MARKTGRAALVLSEEHRIVLTELAGSRTATQREVERAKVLLAYAQGKAPTEIQRALGVSRPTIYKSIDKALGTGVMTGFRDRYHRAKAPQITEAAKAWVVDLACRKPKDLGLAAELWTISSLPNMWRLRLAVQALPACRRRVKPQYGASSMHTPSSPTECATTLSSVTLSSNARWPRCWGSTAT